MYKNRSHDNRLKMSAGLWAVLCMPGALNLAVYYSFATRMHSALGGWPDVIGMAQVPEELMAHYGWMTNLFVINLFFSLFTPIGVVLVGVIPPLRKWLAIPVILTLMSWASLWITQWAPDGFLYWFWD